MRLRGIQQKFFPNTKVLYSPFCGGLSFELDCASRGMTVWANDLCRPVIKFWQAMKANKSELIAAIQREWAAFHVSFDKAACKQRYNKLKAELGDDKIDELDDVIAAAKFWVVHKRSSRQFGLAGGYYHWTTTDRSEFFPVKLDSCGSLASFTFSNQSYEHVFDSLENDVDDLNACLTFVDPPYRQLEADGTVKRSGLYGIGGKLHKPWWKRSQHRDLQRLLKASPVPWMLIHEKNEFIEKLYEGHTVLDVKMHYTRNKICDEVVILSIARVSTVLGLHRINDYPDSHTRLLEKAQRYEQQSQMAYQRALRRRRKAMNVLREVCADSDFQSVNVMKEEVALWEQRKVLEQSLNGLESQLAAMTIMQRHAYEQDGAERELEDESDSEEESGLVEEPESEEEEEKSEEELELKSAEELESKSDEQESATEESESESEESEENEPRA